MESLVASLCPFWLLKEDISSSLIFAQSLSAHIDRAITSNTEPRQANNNIMSLLNYL